MPSYLITGASRGLGLGFAAELLKGEKNIVIATARDTAGSSGLQELKKQDTEGRLTLLDLDVSNTESIRAAAERTKELLPNGLDNLISNAGVSYNALKTFDEIDIEELTSELNFTVTAPILLVREFLPLIRKSQLKKILVLTSTLGSIEIAKRLPNLANGYSIARAALNMLVRKWSTILKNENITMTLIHPGWAGVTEIGDGIKEWIAKYNPSLENLPVEKSASQCMKILDGLTIEDAGAFYQYDGTQVPF